jgi:hypothetical protein
MKTNIRFYLQKNVFIDEGKESQELINVLTAKYEDTEYFFALSNEEAMNPENVLLGVNCILDKLTIPKGKKV